LGQSPFSPREKSRPAHTLQLPRRSSPGAHVFGARPSFPRTPVVKQLVPIRSGVDSKHSLRPSYGQALGAPARRGSRRVSGEQAGSSSAPIAPTGIAPAARSALWSRPERNGSPWSAERHERAELGTGQSPWRGALAPRSSLDLSQRRGRAAGVRPRRRPGPDRRRGAAGHGAVEPGVDDRAADADVGGAGGRAGLLGRA